MAYTKSLVLPVFLIILVAATSLQTTIAQVDPFLGLTEQGKQRKIQEQQEKALLRQQQNWSSYDDPIQGIQFEHPSWWDMIPMENSLRFYADPIGEIATVDYILPPLPERMNTLDKFMRQEMSEIRSIDDKNVSVNRSSTIGVNDLPAYRVEWDRVEPNYETLPDTKFIRYFVIDNSTDAGYMITFNQVMNETQRDVPLFERMVESFKIGT